MLSVPRLEELYRPLFHRFDMTISILQSAHLELDQILVIDLPTDALAMYLSTNL